MSDTGKNDTLAESPKDPVTGAVRPQGGPLDRPGTEAEEKADKDPSKDPSGEPPGAGPGRAGEAAAAYRENDA